MFIVDTRRPNAKNPCWLLRESYREGKKVRNRTIANLSHCSQEEINAMRLALKFKGKLDQLSVLQDDLKLQQGLSVGGVATVLQVAQRLGITQALGSTREGKLALWQVIARVLNQGSRLSAVRLAQDHAACELLNITHDFCEDHLYANLKQLSNNQEQIENKLLKSRRSTNIELFLYDVTSSYFEGEENFFAAFGFQIEKVKKRFGSARVTFVGDRGMIKCPQQRDILENKCHYITAITKAQIETLMKQGLIQYSFFDSIVAEVVGDGCRYVLRRNPVRAEEMALQRQEKMSQIERLIEQQNIYLINHPKAKEAVAVLKVTAKINNLGLNTWLSVESDERKLWLNRGEEALSEAQKLDDCYGTEQIYQLGDNKFVNSSLTQITL